MAGTLTHTANLTRPAAFGEAHERLLHIRACMAAGQPVSALDLTWLTNLAEATISVAPDISVEDGISPGALVGELVGRC